MNLFPNPHIPNLTESQNKVLNEEWNKLVRDEGLEENTGWYITAAVDFVNQVGERKMSVLDDVRCERLRQDKKWGASHDDEHSTQEFVNIIESYSAGARQMADIANKPATRMKLVQVAAITVAAIEALDRQIVSM